MFLLVIVENRDPGALSPAVKSIPMMRDPSRNVLRRLDVSPKQVYTGIHVGFELEF